MKKYLFLALLFVFQNVFAQEPTIKIGAARAKKSNLAFPLFNAPNGGNAAGAEALQIVNVAKKNLELSTYFNVLPAAAFLEDTSKLSTKPRSTTETNGFRFTSWKTIDTEFLIRGTFSIKGKEINIDLYLYNVDRERLVVGKRYKAGTHQTTQIGNTIANDILEALTGTRGFFHSKIIATTDKTGFKEIATMNWDGTNMDILTKDKSIALSPNWSPDGTKALYSLYTRNVQSKKRNLTMFVHDLTKGTRIILSNREGLNSGGSFSPDGKFIYLTISRNGVANIFKLNLRGEEVAQLTNGPAGAMNVEVAVSPDGSKLAFSSDRGGRPMIYVMNSDGTNVKRLTFQGKYNSTPTWSADSKKIAFASQIDSYFDIFVMNVDGSGLTRITTALRTNGRRASHEDPSFSPDGRYIVYTSNRTGKNQIYINTVDGANEHRVTNDSHNYFKPKWSQNIE